MTVEGLIIRLRAFRQQDQVYVGQVDAPGPADHVYQVVPGVVLITPEPIEASLGKAA